jgi:hypothetical protein
MSSARVQQKEIQPFQRQAVDHRLVVSRRDRACKEITWQSVRSIVIPALEIENAIEQSRVAVLAGNHLRRDRKPFERLGGIKLVRQRATEVGVDEQAGHEHFVQQLDRYPTGGDESVVRSEQVKAGLQCGLPATAQLMAATS